MSRHKIDLDAIAKRVRRGEGQPVPGAPITDAASYRAAVQQLSGVFLSDHPVELGGVAVLRPEVAYHRGTTAPDMSLRFGTAASGLAVPESVARQPMPLDLVGVYATGEELFDSSIDPRVIAAAMRERDILTTLGTLAGLLRRVEERPRDPDRDREIAALFKAPYRGRAESLINQGRVLVTAQAIMGLTKLALVLCPPRPRKNPDNPVWILLGLLSLQSSYGRDEASEVEEMPGIRGDVRAVLAIIRSQLFSLSSDIVTTLAHSQLRWRELPRTATHLPQFLDLEGAFQEATGVTLDEFVAVGLAIWMHSENTGSSVLANDGLGISLPRRRIDAAIRLLSATPGELAAEIQRTEGVDGFEWSFDALRRFPVVRLYGAKLIVLSPRLVLERVFSLVRWDVESRLIDRGQSAQAARVRHFWQLMCEADALASLTAMAPDQGLGKRLYHESELARAYGSRRKQPRLADFAIDYPGTWIVGDITSSTLSREIEGSEAQAALESGLMKVVDKARQIESTIRLLRADEAKLTGIPVPGKRHYVPLLVMAEGFPVNAATSALLAHRLEQANLLRDPDVGPLHLIDNEELSIVESLATEGHTILDLLLAHEHGAFANMSLKDYLLVERHLSPSNRTERLQGPFERAWEPIVRAIGTTT